MSDVLRKLYEGVSGESHTYPRSRVDGANVADWKYVEWLESKVARSPAIDREPTPPDIMDVEKVMDTYDEYVALLQDELNDVVLLAHSRGWRSTRYDAGVELREKITLLKAALSDSPPKGCEWTYDDTQGSWHTGCGQDWCLTDGATPAEHGMRYCYHCGKTISTPAEDSPQEGCGECDGSGWKEGIVRCIECNSDGSKKRTPAEQDSTGEAQITQWACGGCGATVNGRQNYCPECGGTLTKGDEDCNGHCNCQQRGQ